MVEFDGDEVLLWEGETDGQVTEVLDELACAMYEFLIPFPISFPG